MAGLDAVAVSDAASFARELVVDPPQMVMLDLQLGATDGIEQLHKLAELQFSGVLVLMSGFDSKVLGAARSVAQGLGLKVEDILQKPLRLEDIETTLKRLPRAEQQLSLAAIDRAIAQDELVLEFQPVVSLNPKSLLTLEALLRWDHPLVGRIAPGVFLPLAESDIGTIDALTDWVMRAAVDAYQVFAQLGISVPISVNISTLNLHDLTLPDRFESYMRAGNMPARHLQLQIAESVAIADPARCVDVLTRLRLKGIGLAINDFGTGFASLRLLQQMPISAVKVHRSFTESIVKSRESASIVKHIIDLAHSLGMSCAAEGVDTQPAATMLEELGVEGVQGDLIAPPMAVEAIPAWHSFWTGIARPAPVAANDQSPIRPAAASQTDAESATVVNGTIRLPPRQQQVVELLAEGCSVKEIARRLGLGVGTVKVHLSLAYSALGARNRIEAIRQAGLLDSPPTRPRATREALAG